MEHHTGYGVGLTYFSGIATGGNNISAHTFRHRRRIIIRILVLIWNEIIVELFYIKELI